VTGGRCDDPYHCITCGDDGTPMRVVAVRDDGLALCETDSGERATVEVLLVGEVTPGDALLVHAGTALTRLQPEAVRA
jgi:hydrogenase expression/formation protein HypC